MASASELIALSNTDPARAYKLSHFIKMGRQAPTINYTDLSYRETYGNVSYVIKNVINDYLPELKQLSYKILLSDSEYEKYKYKPKLLSYDVYGNTEYYIYILLVNDICNVYDFDFKQLLMVPNSKLKAALSSIYRVEKANLIEFNNTHN